MLQEAAAEIFPLAMLFQKEISDLPAVWVELRTFLNSLGDSFTQHSNRSVIMTLESCLYDDAQDCFAEMEMAKLVRA